MYNHILIPTDGSKDAEKGVAHGIELASAVGATVHALYVIPEGGNPWESEPMDDQMARASEYGKSITNEVAEKATKHGVECVQEVVLSQRVSKKINEYAEDEGIDLIVIGSGYRGTLGDMLGGTAEKVIRTSSVPVTVLKRHTSA